MTTLRPAAEWAAAFHRTALVAEGETRPPLVVFVESIQRDALQAAAEVCRDRVSAHEDDMARVGYKTSPYYRYSDIADEAEYCAEAISALIPTAEHGEITKEAET